jgi:predicted Zn finger-like uncharacterized protein
MRIACEKCGTAYDVDAAQVPATGLSMKCTACFHSFTILPPGDQPLGIDLSSDGFEMQLSNDPTDIPQAPAGYVDPTTAGIAGGGGSGGIELADLPGLPTQQPQQGLADLPGLPSQRPQQQPGLADLPGLPSQRPPQQPGLADLPGLPSQRPQQQPGLANLPGLTPQQPQGLTDLPGLPPQQPAAPPPGISGNLPPAPAPPGPSAPGGLPPAPPPLAPGGGDLPELTDLPGLPQGGAPQQDISGLPGLTGNQPQQLTDLPGLPTQQGQLPELTDLPGPVGGGNDMLLGNQPPSAGGNYGEINFDDGGALDLDTDLPAPAGNVGLPAPVGGVDLPAPAGSIGLPAPAGGIGLPAPAGGVGLPAPVGGVDLPAPAGGVDLPAPAGGIDLPAPSGGIDLPAPSSGIDLPAPSGGIDLPAPSGGIDLPAPSGGIDLPTPSEGGLPGGVIDLPGPTGAGGIDADVVAPKPPDEEIIRFEAPEGVEPLPTDADSLVPDADAPVDIRERSRLPSKGVLIGGGVGLVALIGGIILAVTLIGGDSGKSPGEKALDKGKLALERDSYVGYRIAVKRLEDATTKLDEKIVPQALQAQAYAARVVRFGVKKASTATAVLAKLAKTEEPPQELKVARALLKLARKQIGPAIKALKKCADEKPQDASASLYLGWAYNAKPDLTKARAAFKRALAANGKLSGALYAMAHLELKAGKKKAAAALIDKALKASPQHGGALLLKASLELAAGKLEAAEARLKRVSAMVKRRHLGKRDISDLHVYRALLAEKRGETNAARKRYQLALKFNARNAKAQLGAGRLLLAAGKIKEASNHFRSAQTVEPNNIEVAMLLADSMLQLGRPAEARDALVAILKRAPNNPRIRLVMGRVEESVRAYEAAIKQYERAIKLDPKFFEAYRALAGVNLARKKAPEAFDALKRAAKKLPKDARVANAFGEIHFAVREYKAARRRFEEALGIDGKLNAALFNLAQTLVAQGKLEPALKKYQQLQQRDSDFPNLSAGLGALYVKQGDYKAAALAYDKALRVIRPKAALHLAAGRAYVKAGHWEKALKESNALLSKPNYLSDARALRASARLLEGDLGEALGEITRALSRDKKADYYVTQARIFERLRRLAAAIESYRQALKLEPKRIELRLHLARQQVRGGAVKAAMRELKRLLAQKPKNAEAHLFMGIALSDLNKEAKAQAAFLRALSYDPKLGEAHYRLGRLYEDKRNLAGAMKHLGAAAKLGKKADLWWPDAYFNLGRIAEQRKQKAAAIASYKRFLEIARKGDSNRPLAIKSLTAYGAYKKKEDY